MDCTVKNGLEELGMPHKLHGFHRKNDIEELGMPHKLYGFYRDNGMEELGMPHKLYGLNRKKWYGGIRNGRRPSFSPQVTVACSNRTVLCRISNCMA